MTEIAVQGMLTAYRSTADGGVRLTVDLDELQAQLFREGFGVINIAVVVARIHESQEGGEES